MEIKTEQLENFFALIIQKLNQEKITKIELDEELYWEIPFEQFIEIDKPIENMEVGSFDDDWKILQTSLKNGIILDNNDFNRLANILKAIGLKMDTLCEI